MFEQTGCDAVMIGRGARGNPWIFSQVGRYLKDQTVLAPPTTKEICDMILRHAKMLIEAKGEYTGIREMRKHLAWYTAGMKHSAALRGRVNQVEHFEELDAYTPSADTAQKLADTGITIGTVYEAQDASGTQLGYVIQTTTSEGYGGNIVLYVGIRLDGTVNDISILSISETPGLGMKAGDVLVPQFHNKNVKSFAYTKTGSTSDSEIDAISGATITTKAVTNAVNGSLLAFSDYVQGGAGNE